MAFQGVADFKQRFACFCFFTCMGEQLFEVFKFVVNRHVSALSFNKPWIAFGKHQLCLFVLP